jgi:CDP-4-dehydro-6-deoxyglucose reductase
VPVVTVPLADVAVETPRSRLVAVDIRDRAFDFIAGQAVLIGKHGQPERRPYSIACSPERAAETRRLELLMALEPNGELGPHLPAATAGMLVDVDGPLGTFIVPEGATQPPLLFVAGGTGIAPLRAMIDHVLRRQPSRKVSVLYSARRGDEFAFIGELRAHADFGRIELQQTVTRDDSATWAGGRGRIGRAHFEIVLHEPAATLCFVCGPRTMVTEAVATLRELGVPDTAIRTEGWAVPRL